MKKPRPTLKACLLILGKAKAYLKACLLILGKAKAYFGKLLRNP
jgi:hypothetical protein